jgi:hypothetical protein
MSSGASALAPTKSMKRSLNHSNEEKRMPLIAKYLNELVKVDKKILRCDTMMKMWDDAFVPTTPEQPVTEPVRVLMSGYLQKRGAVNKSWKNRYHVLTSNGLLSYFEEARSVDNLQNSLGEISIDGDTTVDRLVGCKAMPSITWPKGSDPNCCFWVLTPQRVYYYVAPSEAEASKWIKSLRHYWLEVLRKTYESVYV